MQWSKMEVDFTPPQEEFLTRLFDLCNQYKDSAQVYSYGQGVVQGDYSITIYLHVQNNRNQSPDSGKK